jgi:hypothetical protein
LWIDVADVRGHFNRNLPRGAVREGRSAGGAVGDFQPQRAVQCSHGGPVGARRGGKFQP